MHQIVVTIPQYKSIIDKRLLGNPAGPTPNNEIWRNSRRPVLFKGRHEKTFLAKSVFFKVRGDQGLKKERLNSRFYVFPYSFRANGWPPREGNDTQEDQTAPNTNQRGLLETLGTRFASGCVQTGQEVNRSLNYVVPRLVTNWLLLWSNSTHLIIFICDRPARPKKSQKPF